MKKENIKKMLFFLLLLSLLVGIVSATSISNNTDTHTLEKQSHTEENTIAKESDNTSKIKTTLTVKKIKNTEYSKNTTITGKYTDHNGKNLKNTTIQLKINNKKYTTKTDNNGTYTFNYNAKTPGKNNITISYPGNSKYMSTTIKSTFNVTSKKTLIKINKIPDTYYNSISSISGYYIDSENKPLKNTLLKIKINNENRTTKTDNTGYFNHKYTAKNIGSNNITISYPGNKKYNGTTTKTTFNVKTNPTKIILDKIKNTTYKKNITISGKYVDSNNKALMNTRIQLKINGKKYAAKTDKNGIFKKHIKANQPENNTITATYPGNNKYAKASVSNTFHVAPMKTRISFNITTEDIHAAYYITVNGKFTNEEGSPLKNTLLTITSDEGIPPSTEKTDDKGEFEAFYSVKSPGHRVITLSFKGNKKYSGTQSNKTFYAQKMITEIYVSPTNSMKIGKTVEIKGRIFFGYPDETSNVTVPVTLNVNGKSNTLKTYTDNYNDFTFKFKADTVGVNNVTLNCLGNEYCLKSKAEHTFYVYNQTEAFISCPYPWYDKIDKKYEFYGIETYEYTKTHNMSTVYVDGRNYSTPVNKITGAKLYLKDNKGIIKTENYTRVNKHTYNVEYDTRYTPYKLELTLSEVNDLEREYYYDE